MFSRQRYVVNPEEESEQSTSGIITMASRPFGILVNLIITIIVALPILILYLVGVPFKRGFFCDDETIAHPYESSTISSTVLYVVGFAVPLIAIVVVEGWVYSLPRTSQEDEVRHVP